MESRNRFTAIFILSNEHRGKGSDLREKRSKPRIIEGYLLQSLYNAVWLKTLKQGCQIDVRYLNLLQSFLQRVVSCHWVLNGVAHISTGNYKQVEIYIIACLLAKPWHRKLLVLYDIDC